jgi:hypothetical protein
MRPEHPRFLSGERDREAIKLKLDLSESPHRQRSIGRILARDERGQGEENVSSVLEGIRLRRTCYIHEITLPSHAYPGYILII